MYKVNKTIYLQIINRVFVFQLNCFVVQFLVFPAYYGNFSIHVSGNYPFQYFLAFGHPFTSAHYKYYPGIDLKAQFFTYPYLFEITYFLGEFTVENKGKYMHVVFINTLFYTFFLK